jgi:hypothetical protein
MDFFIFMLVIIGLGRILGPLFEDTSYPYIFKQSLVDDKPSIGPTAADGKWVVYEPMGFCIMGVGHIDSPAKKLWKRIFGRKHEIHKGQ